MASLFCSEIVDDRSHCVFFFELQLSGVVQITRLSCLHWTSPWLIAEVVSKISFVVKHIKATSRNAPIKVTINLSVLILIHLHNVLPMIEHQQAKLYKLDALNVEFLARLFYQCEVIRSSVMNAY